MSILQNGMLSSMGPELKALPEKRCFWILCIANEISGEEPTYSSKPEMIRDLEKWVKYNPDKLDEFRTQCIKKWKEGEVYAV
ncbi:hypothetical protein [Vibrio crassostreae]|uniref:hypothetical protein n=1 Tax=Vibrio crassostreae TaxID=246167 RepID=UPI001B3100D4|nr:hypothetical protein [Vibrio crassostreae]